MNALTTTSSNALANFSAGGDPFSAAAQDMGASDGTFLKFSGKTGEWTYGKDEDELPPGTRLAVNMMEFKRGFICWNDGEVDEEIMIKVVDGSPPWEHQLNDHGPYKTYEDGTKDGWSAQAAVPFTSGDGEMFLYKTSSKSGTRALAGLLKDFGKQFRNHPSQVPLVEIDANEFTPKNAKKGSKAYAPTFKIVDWVDAAALEVAETDGPAEDVEDGEDPSDYTETRVVEAPKEETKVVEAPKEEPKKAAPAEVADEAPVDRPAPVGRRAKRF